MEKWRGIAFNDLLRILKSGAYAFLPPMKESARKRGIQLDNGSIANFLANKYVEGYIKSKLKE